MKNQGFETYLDYKRAFIRKHNKADWTVDTSAMDADGKYCKIGQGENIKVFKPEKYFDYVVD